MAAPNMNEDRNKAPSKEHEMLRNDVSEEVSEKVRDEVGDEVRDRHPPAARRSSLASLALASIKQWARRLKQDAVTLWFACRHPGTPLAAKLISAVVVAYALSPIDPIPDFIPVLGFIDEAIVLPLLIWGALNMIPATVLQECRASGEAWMAREGKKPRSRWGVALVIALWLGIAWGFWALVVAPQW